MHINHCHQKCHSHAVSQQPNQAPPPLPSANWKEISQMIFRKLRNDVSSSCQRVSGLWSQAQVIQPLKVAIRSLMPSRIMPTPPLEVLKDDDQIVCKKLSNGFTYYLRPNDHRSKNRAYIQLTVKTGHLDEKKEELGIAHLVEHLLQIRTKNYEKGEIDRYFSSKGILWGSGDNNASTGDCVTEYHIEIPTEDPEVLEKTLHIFSEMAFQAELLDQYIHHEKTIVCDELQSKQSAGMRYHNQFRQFLFQGTPYAKRPLRSEDEVNNVTVCPPHIVREFYRKWYQPQNMSLTVVGEINPEKIEQSIVKHFGSTPKGKSLSAKHHYKIPSPSRPQFLCFTDKEVTLSQGEFYYKLPPVPVTQTTTIQEVKDELTDEILKLIMNRRLGEMLAYSNNAFIQAGVSMPDTIKGNPSLRLAFTAKEGAIISSFKALLIELKRLKEHGIDPKEFLKAKSSFISVLNHLSKDTGKVDSGTFAEICEAHFDQSCSLTHPDTLVDAKMKLIETITLDDLTSRMRYLLQHDYCHMGIVQPQKEGLKAIDEKDLKNALDEVKKEQVSRYEYIAFEKSLLTNLPTPGKIVDTVIHPVSGVTKYTLENGVTVYAKHTTNSHDSILMHGYALRGKRDTDLKDRISAKFCERFFDSCGLGEFSLTELKKILNDKTVSFASTIGNYQTNIKISAGKKDLDAGFQMLYILFTNPGYSKQAFDSALAKFKETLQNKNLHPRISFSEEINRVNTQDHVEFQSFSMEDLEKVDYETCKKIHKDFYANPSDFTFVITGNYSEAQLKEYIELYLASLPSDGKKREQLTFPPVPFPKGIIYKQVDGGNSLSNSLNVMTFPSTVGDSPLEDSLSNLCTKVVHERLIKNLRLKLGITYTPSCAFTASELPGLHTSRPQTSTIILTGHPDNIKDLEEATIRELQSLHTFGPKEQEVEDCKTALYKSIDKQFETDKGWLLHVYTSAKWKTDIEKIDAERELLKSITPEMIREHCKKLYPLSNYTMVSLIPSAEKPSK